MTYKLGDKVRAARDLTERDLFGDGNDAVIVRAGTRGRVALIVQAGEWLAVEFDSAGVEWGWPCDNWAVSLDQIERVEG